MSDDVAAEECTLRAILGPKKGRPRTLSPEGGDKAKNLTVRANDAHRAELEALIADGHAENLSGAVHYLIEQSAERRALTVARQT